MSTHARSSSSPARRRCVRFLSRRWAASLSLPSTLNRLSTYKASTTGRTRAKRLAERRPPRRPDLPHRGLRGRVLPFQGEQEMPESAGEQVTRVANHSMSEVDEHSARRTPHHCSMVLGGCSREASEVKGPGAGRRLDIPPGRRTPERASPRVALSLIHI